MYSPGHAQTLEEVVVSAQKREQNSQDVGIALTVFTAADFASLELRNSTDLVALTPGVSLAGSYGGEFLTFSIRGVTQSDFSDHAESPTSVYVDDGYVAMIMTQRFALFDMDRAEILKGPQGTLFGRNSTGGNVNFVSLQPTDVPEGYVNLSYGSFDTTRLEAAVSGPLAERITGRLAVLYSFQSPILKNSYPGAGDLWNDNTYAYRGHLKLQVTEDTEALLTAYGGQSATASSPWQWKGTIGVLNAKGQLVNVQNVGATETRECIGPGGANVDCGNDVTGKRMVGVDTVLLLIGNGWHPGQMRASDDIFGILRT
jgi:iron complex outermembrane receptor protein